MFASRRWILWATSISAVMVLSACQPTTEDNETSSGEKVTPPVTDITDIQNENEDVIEAEDVADESEMTDVLRDYTRSMTRMHDEMMIGMGYNDPDTAFAKAMLGHHRGAVEMAKIQLKYGTDEEMRQLAQAIIDGQQTEIEHMQQWIVDANTDNKVEETQGTSEADNNQQSEQAAS